MVHYLFLKSKGSVYKKSMIFNSMHKHNWSLRGNINTIYLNLFEDSASQK
jgi:hypothetical protein